MSAASVVALLSGCASTTSATAPVPGTDFSGRVDVGGGRQMFVECRGTGSPTVILMAGKGNGAADWSQILSPDDPVRQAAGDDLPLGDAKLLSSDDAVLPRVAQFTRGCAYDRPDVRFDGEVTTPRQQPHTVDADVADLGALFDAIGETGPKVLVPHSYSGVIAMLYARTHPDDVAGLVMDDALSEDMALVAGPDHLAYWAATNAATSDQVREGVQVLDAFEQINAAPPLHAMPAAVLVADKPWRTDLLPAEIRDKGISFDDWTEHEALLADRLAARWWVTETNSGHDIHLYNPALVVDAISSVVDAVRDE